MQTTTFQVEPSSKNVLLRTIQIQVEIHHSDPQLNVSRLLRYVGMSRTDLHRKLIRLTGMSATQYIRYVRLQKAARLLITQPERNINQISFDVGYNSQSYFTKTFTELFGLCPSNYRKAYSFAPNQGDNT